MKKIPSWQLYIILFSVTIIGGINYSVSKLIMPSLISPKALLVLRGTATIFVFALLYFIWVRQKIEKKEKMKEKMKAANALV